MKVLKMRKRALNIPKGFKIVVCSSFVGDVTGCIIIKGDRDFISLLHGDLKSIRIPIITRNLMFHDLCV